MSAPTRFTIVTPKEIDALRSFTNMSGFLSVFETAGVKPSDLQEKLAQHVFNNVPLHDLGLEVQIELPLEPPMEVERVDHESTPGEVADAVTEDIEPVEPVENLILKVKALEESLEQAEADADDLRKAAADFKDKELAAKAEADRLFIENYGFKHRKRMKVSPEDEAKFAELLRNQRPIGPKAVVTRMDFVKKKKLYWLWENRIPYGFLSTIAGDPDEGKSLITLYLAACVSKGEKLYENKLETEPGEVLLLSAEDDPEITLNPRLEAAGAALDRIHLLESVMLTNGPGQEGSERLAQLDTDIKAIERILDENPAITLIIIDPISSFLGSANMNREQEVRRVLEPLRRRARKSGIAVVMVAHFNKNSETRSAMDRVGGAKAIVGMGRAAWVCVREPKKEQQPGEPMQVDQDRHLFLKLKANLTPSRIGGLVYNIQTKMIEVEDKHLKSVMEEQPYIAWLEETGSTAQEVVIGGQAEKTVPKSKSVKEWLKTYLEAEGGYADSSEIRDAAKEAGYSQATLYRAYGQLKV